jgi:hypothetical protein
METAGGVAPWFIMAGFIPAIHVFLPSGDIIKRRWPGRARP